MSSRSKAAVNIHEERERGFRTHFSGANDDGKRTKNVNPPAVVAVRNTDPVRNPIRERARKGWTMEPPKFILGADGPIQLSAPKPNYEMQKVVPKQSNDMEDQVFEEEEEEHEELTNNIDDSVESFYEDADQVGLQGHVGAEYPNEFDDNSNDIEEEYIEEAFEDLSDVDDELLVKQPMKGERVHVGGGSHSLSSHAVFMSQDDSSVYFNEKSEGDRTNAAVAARVVLTAHGQHRSSKPVIRPVSAAKKHAVFLEYSRDDESVDEIAAAILKENNAMKALVDSDVERKEQADQATAKSSTKHKSPEAPKLKPMRAASDGDLGLVAEARDPKSTTEDRSESTTDALLRRLANLDPDKQRLLLGLLNKLDSTAIGESDQQKSPPKGVSGVQEERRETGRWDKPGVAGLSDATDEADNASDLPVVRDSCDLVSEGKTSVEKDAAVVAPQSDQRPTGSLATLVVPDPSLRLRIRIHTTWGKTKTASLGTIRLRLSSLEEDIDLSALSTKVSAGFLPLPQTSEAVRTLSNLFYKGAGPNTAAGGWRAFGGESPVWKGPLDSGKSLEIAVDGAVRLRAGYESVQGMLDDLELWVWNADTDGVSFVGSTATRDMDVFVGQTCVWSGQLNQPVIPAKPSVQHKKVLGDPSVKIPLVKQEILINKKPSAPFPSKQVQSAVVPAAGPALDTQDTYVPVVLVTQQNQQSGQDEDASKPVWLSASTPSVGGRVTPSSDSLNDVVVPAAASTKPAPAPRRRWGSGATPVAENSDNPQTTGIAEALRARTNSDSAQQAAKEVAPTEEKRRSRWDVPRKDGTDAVVEEQHGPRASSRGDSRDPSGERRRPRERSVDGGSSTGQGEPVKLEPPPSSDVSPTATAAGGIAAIAPRKRRSSLAPSPTPGTASDAVGSQSVPPQAPTAVFVRMGIEAAVLPSLAGLVDATDVLFKQQDDKAAESSLEDRNKDKKIVANVREIKVGIGSSGAANGSGASDEMNLRRSLEAVQQSDRLNRGRLEYSVDPTKDRDSRLKLRAQRIGEVNVHVQSALANLATVMSSISSASSQRRKVESGDDAATAAAAEKHFSSKPPVASRSAPATIQEEDEDVPEDAASCEGTQLQQLECPLPNTDGILSELAELQPPKQQAADWTFSSMPLESSLCEIPTLPKGRRLLLEVLSTWGDPHYVGLNGIEIFDDAGNFLGASSVENLSADPPDINVLEEYSDDPRVVGNLLDGCNFTRNDLHVWLAPYGTLKTYDTDNLVAVISITLKQTAALSLVRVWNYNKSRTHCYRGVRRCRMKLDETVIFDGEIKIAPGVLDSAEACSEAVLFTLDQAVLTKVARYDEERGLVVKDSTPKWLSEAELARPGTAGGASEPVGGTEIPIKRRAKAAPPLQPYEESAAAGRPTTAAIRPEKKPAAVVTVPFRSMSDAKNKPSERATAQLPPVARSKDSGGVVDDVDLCLCSGVGLRIETTWGDPSFVGLTGLEILIGTSCQPATDINPDSLLADPWDLSAIGCFDDYRVPGNVLNGINDTTDDRNMWLIPFTPGGVHLLTVDLGEARQVAGFRVWNYNKSLEDTLRGAKQVSVLVDGQTIGRTLLRLGPGCDGSEFGQTVLFRDLLRPSPTRFPVTSSPSYSSPSVRQDYETPTLPSGLLWKFSLYTNCGDQYFVGLDAIEFYDPSGRRIDVTGKGRVTAVPHSLRDLASSPLDSRVPENLFGSAGRDESGLNSWLSPLAPCMTEVEREASGLRVMRRQPAYSLVSSRYENSKAQMVAAGAFDVDEEEEDDDGLYLFEPQNLVFVAFDQPVTVAYIRIYNYSKSPTRGVRDFGLDVDGRLLYMGSLSAADKDAAKDGQSILFTNDAKVVRSEKGKVLYCGSTEQDVLCINEKQVMVRSKGMFEQPNATTAGIYTDIDNRPATSLQR